MIRRIRFAAVGLACGLLAFAHAGLAVDKADLVRRGKAATALVDVASKEFGTAFCVDAGGYFVTNAHVVKRAARDQTVSLVLQPGEAEQRVVTARVVRSDEKADLALLEVQKATGLIALELGDSAGVVETAAVTVFGYPFGKLLSGVAGEAAAADYPSVSVNMGRVTSLRKSGGELQRIQLDASLNPGNSGGPVLDEEGKAVGVVVSGVIGAGVNFAIPASRVRAFLATPELSITPPPPLSPANKYSPQPFRVRVVMFDKPAGSGPPAVELALQGGGGPRKFVAKPDPSAPGTYVAKAAAFVPPAGGRRVRVTATFATGTITGLAKADAPIRVGAGPATRAARLEEVAAADATAATLVGGSKVAGEIGGLEAVELDLGGLLATLDLSRARAVEVAPAAGEEDRVEYRVTVSRDGKVLAESAGDITVAAAAPASPAGAGLTVGGPAANKVTATFGPDGMTTVKLPAPVDDVTVAGGGRYLILTLRRLNKLAVFDVLAGRVAEYVSLPPNDVRIAAGADKLFVILVDQKVIQRYSLSPVRRELTAMLPFDGAVTAAVMGSASKGPLLVRWASGTDNLTTTHCDFLDPVSLRRLNIADVATPQYAAHREGVHIRASADGSVFGLWTTNVTPSGMSCLVLAGGKATLKYEHVAVGHVVPGPDGRVLFTGSGGVYNDQLRRIGAIVPPSPNGAAYMTPPATYPANLPGYYLRVPLVYRDPGIAAANAAPTPAGSVCLAGNDRPLVPLPPLPELVLPNDAMWAPSDFTVDKRVLFLPSDNLLVTVPTTNDSIVLRRFEMIAELDKAGIDYLFVTSSPPLTARAGEEYRYQIQAKAKRPGVTYKLESGPDGMAVSPSGLATWRVPATPPAEASVIITVRDGAGQEVFHTFTVTPSTAGTASGPATQPTPAP